LETFSLIAPHFYPFSDFFGEISEKYLLVISPAAEKVKKYLEKNNK